MRVLATRGTTLPVKIRVVKISDIGGISSAG
jgi:hypothetical protein